MKTIDIRINKKLIQTYKPCLGGLANFNTYYTDISIAELINSKKISYDHKLWLLKHIVPDYLLVLWAIDSAFAAYAYSAISNNVANASEAADYAYCAAFYAANAFNYVDYAERAGSAYYTANYAIRASRHVDISTKDAEKERLQSLLYFIEGE